MHPGGGGDANEGRGSGWRGKRARVGGDGRVPCGGTILFSRAINRANNRKKIMIEHEPYPTVLGVISNTGVVLPSHPSFSPITPVHPVAVPIHIIMWSQTVRQRKTKARLITNQCVERVKRQRTGYERTQQDKPDKKMRTKGK